MKGFWLGLFSWVPSVRNGNGVPVLFGTGLLVGMGGEGVGFRIEGFAQGGKALVAREAGLTGLA